MAEAEEASENLYSCLQNGRRFLNAHVRLCLYKYPYLGQYYGALVAGMALLIPEDIFTLVRQWLYT